MGDSTWTMLGEEAHGPRKGLFESAWLVRRAAPSDGVLGCFTGLGGVTEKDPQPPSSGLLTL